MNRRAEQGRPDWRWAAAAALGTPLTLLIISGWAGIQLNPHSLSILMVPVSVLSGLVATPIGAFWLVSTAKREGAAALASPWTLASIALIVVNAAAVAYALPRMRW